MAKKRDGSIKKKIKRAARKSKKRGGPSILLPIATAVALLGAIFIVLGFVVSKGVFFALGGVTLSGGLVLFWFVLFPSQGPKKLKFKEHGVEMFRADNPGELLGRLPFANVATVELATVGIRGGSYRIRSMGETYSAGMREQADDYADPDVTAALVSLAMTEGDGMLVTRKKDNVTSALLVTLYNPNDSKTFWPTWMDEASDFDVIILDDFDLPLNTIKRNILEGVRCHLENKTGGGQSPRQ